MAAISVAEEKAPFLEALAAAAQALPRPAPKAWPSRRRLLCSPQQLPGSLLALQRCIICTSRTCSGVMQPPLPWAAASLFLADSSRGFRSSTSPEIRALTMWRCTSAGLSSRAGRRSCTTSVSLATKLAVTQACAGLAETMRAATEHSAGQSPAAVRRSRAAEKRLLLAA